MLTMRNESIESCNACLTTASSGRPKGRFAPFGPPLVSNVRPQVMSLTRYAVALCLASGAVSAWSSDEPKLSAEYDRCVGATTATSSLLSCEAAEWKQQDKRLNVAYAALQANLSKAKVEELRKVQRTWLGYVRAKCGFLFDGEDFNGSLDRLAANYCEVVERARRADELEVLAKH